MSHIGCVSNYLKQSVFVENEKKMQLELLAFKNNFNSYRIYK